MTTLDGLVQTAGKLPEQLQEEVRDFAQFLAERASPRTHRFLKQTWAGALKDLRDQYTSLELQKKARE